jgi:hypothetical protein
MGFFLHGEDGDSPGVPSTSTNVFAAPRSRGGSHEICDSGDLKRPNRPLNENVACEIKDLVLKECRSMRIAVAIIYFVMLTGALFGQASSYCAAHPRPLSCRVINGSFPAFSQPLPGSAFQGNPAAALIPAIASGASLVPIASPASGIVYTIDPNLQILVPSGTGPFGPVLPDRGETIRRHKLFFAFTYQHFGFDKIDGHSLKSIPTTYFTDNGVSAIDTQTLSRLDLKINQFVAFATYGVTDHFDLSLSIPILDVRVFANSSCVKAYDQFAAAFVPCTFSTVSSPGKLVNYTEQSGTATGLGDVSVRGKIGIVRREHLRFAGGIDVRFPTGDSLNFLGTGALGLSPFLAANYEMGHFSPHIDAGFQWNGDSNIASMSGPGVNGKLPNYFSYAVGGELRAAKPLSFAADYIGQHFFDSLSEGVAQTPLGGYTFLDAQPESRSFNVSNVAIGVKVNPVGKTLITANVLFRVGDNGLRFKAVPLVGISYLF